MSFLRDCVQLIQKLCTASRRLSYSLSEVKKIIKSTQTHTKEIRAKICSSDYLSVIGMHYDFLPKNNRLFLAIASSSTFDLSQKWWIFVKQSTIFDWIEKPKWKKKNEDRYVKRKTISQWILSWNDIVFIPYQIEKFIWIHQQITLSKQWKVIGGKSGLIQRKLLFLHRIKIEIGVVML